VFLGCHLSISKGFLSLGREALSLGANTCQFFTRNPRGARGRELRPTDVASFLQLAAAHGFGPMVAHAPYTLNPASQDPRVASLAQDILRDDFRRLALMPGIFYNLHPGCHLGRGAQAGMDKAMELLSQVYPEDGKTVVLLETMAGKGTELGRDFAELAYMLGRFQYPDRIGVCLDTCHVHDAGYDLIEDLEGVLREFDQTIGLARLKVIHLNDSLSPRGARKDRHAKIGQGLIGLSTLARLISHPSLAGRPVVLETPNDPPGFAAEIELIRKTLGLKRAFDPANSSQGA
jgi:deoxyribonuclease-4